MRKHRLFYAPLLVWLGGPLARILDSGVRVLPQRDWEERERRIYWTLYGTSIRIDVDGMLVLPCLAGETLATLLDDPELDESVRKRAIEAAVVALAEFHRLGFTHGDAMAENVLVDLEAGVAHWFDFETVHEANRPIAWRRADDVRALLVTCLFRTVPERRAKTLQLILDVYADEEVTRLLAASFTSVLRRPLTFHLAQAGLSFQCFREIARLLRSSRRIASRLDRRFFSAPLQLMNNSGVTLVDRCCPSCFSRTVLRCQGGTMMKVIPSLCVSACLAGTVLVSTASAQAIDDTPIDPIAVENGSAGWFPSRYGAGDQLGALNEITPQKTLAALSLIKNNKNKPPKSYNLGEVMERGVNAFGTRVYQQTRVGPSFGPNFAGDNDIVGVEETINTTYQIATQVDGLPHIGVRSVFYNGFTAADLVAAGPDGVAVLGQEHVDPFITRGILLDVLSEKVARGDTLALGVPIDGKPILADSYRITVEDLEDAMKFGGIKEITPGDVVIIRTGWSHLFGTDPALRARYIGAEPGIYLREARWLAQFRPAIVASDAPALEVLPAPAPWTTTQFFPVHQELLTHHGIRIGEAFNSEELAADRLYEFVFFYTPQRGKGATASNTAPAALGQPNFRGRP